MASQLSAEQTAASPALAPGAVKAEPRASEPWDIRFMRRCLQQWPFPRGKGVLLRLFNPFLKDRGFVMELERGVLVEGRLDDWMIRHYFLTPHDRDPAVRLSRRLIRPGHTVFDIGANVGLWVMGAVRGTGPTGDVHAFEPVPDNLARLRTNLALNGLGWVRCQSLAMSDRCGHTTFYACTTGNSGLGSLASRDGINQAIDIECITLDEYCKRHEVRHVDFMKVDVEGAEILVFRGGKETLSRADAPIVMVEVSEPLAAPFGSSPRVVKELLQEYGYTLFRYQGGRLERAGLEESHWCDDLFALKPSHFQAHPFLASLAGGRSLSSEGVGA